MKKISLVRITTVPISLKHLINGQMKFMSENGFDVIMISSSGHEIKEIIKKENCQHITVSLTRKITPYKDLIATYRLFKILKKIKPTIVHTHTPKAGIVGMLASFLANVPIRIHTVAGLPLLEARGIKRLILNLVEKSTYSLSSKIYPNSYGLKNIILQKKFAPERKIKVVGNGSSNGIDTSFFDPNLISRADKISLRKSLKIKKNDFVFIFVGRIVTDKGINEILEAFCKLSNIYNDVKLLLVGPFEDNLSPINNKSKRYISSNDNILTVGYQNDVRLYFSISNLLVFPSYREGFPNVVLQSGSMGLPSIVSDINGCNEIIENNKNGIIIPKKNIDLLFKAMSKFYLNKEFYKKIKLNCRIMIKKKFERKLFWNLLLDEYYKLIKSNFYN